MPRHAPACHPPGQPPSMPAYLAAHATAKDAVDERGLCHLGQGFGLHPSNARLMHGVQQRNQELVGILLAA